MYSLHCWLAQVLQKSSQRYKVILQHSDSPPVLNKYSTNHLWIYGICKIVDDRWQLTKHEEDGKNFIHYDDIILKCQVLQKIPLNQMKIKKYKFVMIFKFHNARQLFSRENKILNQNTLFPQSTQMVYWDDLMFGDGDIYSLHVVFWKSVIFLIKRD